MRFCCRSASRYAEPQPPGAGRPPRGITPAFVCVRFPSSFSALGKAQSAPGRKARSATYGYPGDPHFHRGSRHPSAQLAPYPRARVPGGEDGRVRPARAHAPRNPRDVRRARHGRGRPDRGARPRGAHHRAARRHGCIAGRRIHGAALCVPAPRARARVRPRRAHDHGARGGAAALARIGPPGTSCSSSNPPRSRAAGPAS